ncbi:P-loop NTPase, partial [Caldisericum sp.]|uniref:P-loop NTPase n=1 Tax=Caldisericum sp. TaxID=2499687 RepID=UPI003D13F17C
MSNTEKENELQRLEKLLARNMAQITAKILVLSNKGGVGKSSVAVNIAVCLSRKGAKVGLLDADMHGPSVAKMLGFEGQKLPTGLPELFPYDINPNLCAFSIASLLKNPDTPVIWRGPLKMGVLKQFLAEVNWGKLDYLVIDSPPGTGDEPLSICQMIKDLTGAIIVTTPQDIALLDSRKCVHFLRQLSTPILGILENMSGFICPHCGKEIDIIKTRGGEKAARELGIPFLGRISLDPHIVESTDNGKPIVEAYPNSESAKVLMNICKS